jgi:hypothetical protein
MPNQFTNFGSTFMSWDVAVIQARINELNPPATLKPTPLKQFSTLFSELPSPSGIINVPINNYSSTADSGTGLTVSPVSASTVSLIVNQPITKFAGYNVVEVQQYGLDNLINNQILPGIYACDRTLVSASLAVALNAANFSTSSLKLPNSSSVDITAIGNIQSAMSNAGINGNRFGVFAPTYYWGAVSNIAKTGNAAGAAALQAGSPNNPMGMSVYEAQDLPPLPVNTAATSSIAGFVGVGSAIAVGTALPLVSHANGQAVPITSPWTGVTYLMENWFDENVTRQHIMGPSLIYGVTKVQNTILQLATV